MVQVIRYGINFPFCSPDLFHRKIKQIPVIGLKFDHAVFFQYHIIAFQKLPAGQTTLCMAVLRPRIRKIQIDPVDLPFRKYICDIFRIHTDKAQIRQRILFHLLQGPQQNRRILLDPKIIELRMLCRQRHQETPFSHTDLQTDGLIVSEDRLPLSFSFLRIMYNKRILRDHFPGSRNISQTHKSHSLSV